MRTGPGWYPHERYRVDAKFRQVVDSLEMLIVGAQLTPGEVRDAAMLAAINYESRVRRSWLTRDSVIERDWKVLDPEAP